MIDELKRLEQEARAEISGGADAARLEELRVKYLGRKGLFAALSQRIKDVEPDRRKEAGRELNRVKTALEEILAPAAPEAAGTRGVPGGCDTTMPGTFTPLGSLHPLTLVIRDLTRVFERLGFSVVSGPEAETEHYNFEALNIPLDHPARDAFDTFYLDDGRLLRSQTSPVQIRVMERNKPPLKIIAPGKVYRPDATDATHSFQFHQIEGLMVDEDVTFAQLKGVLLSFAKEFFGPSARLRFRPHFFPFTEPSAEIDVYLEGRGWLEILGAGMVHPHVLRSVKIDPARFSGFAFGMGVERIAMLKYGVTDIRMFFENDLRFLGQFA